MSSPIVIFWPPTNTDGVALQQNVLATNNLILQSNLVGYPFGPFVYDKMIRKISLTSANDLSGSSFTIVGIGSPIDANGNPTETIHEITEVIGGPNVGTVESVNIYTQITSITVDTNSNGISVGFGDRGITDYVFLDNNRTFYDCALQFQFVTTAGIEATAYHSLSRPQVINSLHGNLDPFQPLPYFEVDPDLTDVTDNAYATALLTRTVWANIKNTAADSLYFTVVQQGIT